MIVTRWPHVAALYDAELDNLVEAPERFVELGLRTAQIFEVQLEDVDGAILRYRRVSEVDAENQSAIRALDRLFVQTERWRDLAAILGREAEIGTSPDEILELKYRLGQVHQLRLANLDAAIAAYRDVLNAAPEHAATLAALEELFAGGVKQVEIAEILEPLYRAASEWEKLSRVHEAQLAHVPTDQPEERLAAYYRIAELLEEKLLDAPATLEVYIRALKEYPLDEKTGEEIPRLAATIDGGWETVANAFADVLGLHAEPAVQRSIGKRLAKTFEDELGDISKAEETYKYVLGVDPLDVEALANLDRIYTSLESWPELAGVLEQRVKGTEDALELVDLYARLGETYETKLSDTENAIRAYRAIFDKLDRAHDAAIQALARVYEGLGSWTELNVVYERELENASGDVAEAEIRAKIATLAATRLGDPARAIDTWKLVLDLRGEDPEALTALSNLYETGQAWRELGDVLERLFDIAQTDDDRVNILTRRARIFSDKLTRDDLAIEDWTRVLDIDYANLAALRAIAAIRRRQLDPSELVQALHQVVDRAASLLDEDQLKEIFRELGQDVRRARSRSRSMRRRRGGSSSRSAPTSRPWTLSRGSIAPRSAGPTSSTSRCSAPPRWKTRRSRSRSTARSPGCGPSRRRSPTLRRRRGRRSVRSTLRTTKRSSSWRSSTPPPAAGSRSSSCISPGWTRGPRPPSGRRSSGRSRASSKSASTTRARRSMP